MGLLLRTIIPYKQNINATKFIYELLSLFYVYSGVWTEIANSVIQWKRSLCKLCCFVVATERLEMEQKQKQPTPLMYFSNHGSVLTRRIAGIEQVATLKVTLYFFWYRDSVDNIVEENSSVFSLIRVC